jgi:hypothetical protein
LQIGLGRASGNFGQQLFGPGLYGSTGSAGFDAGGQYNANIQQAKLLEAQLIAQKHKTGLEQAGQVVGLAGGILGTGRTNG